MLRDDYGFGAANNAEGVLGFGFGATECITLLVDPARPGFPYAALKVMVDGAEAQVPLESIALARVTVESQPAIEAQGIYDIALGSPCGPRPGLSVGTWAAFVAANSGGLAALTAAHLWDVSAYGDVAWCGDEPLGRFRTLGSDVACIDLLPEVAARAVSATPAGDIVLGARLVDWSDLGSPVRAFCPTGRRTLPSRVLAVGMMLHLLPGASQTGMVMTEAFTRQGDSGTGLIAGDGRVIGILSHGGLQFSFFEAMPTSI